MDSALAILSLHAKAPQRNLRYTEESIDASRLAFTTSWKAPKQVPSFDNYSQCASVTANNISPLQDGGIIKAQCISNLFFYSFDAKVLRFAGTRSKRA